MTKAKMEELAQRQLEAYNRRDIDAFCACYHPEVKVVRLLSGVTTINNLNEFRENGF